MLLILLVFLLVGPSKLHATCRNGWTAPKCTKTGVAWGDPHYTTFDGWKYYNFMGRYEYIFAKDCKNKAFEVLQKNEICNPSSTRSVTCTKSVKVLFGTTEIKLKRAGIVYVNGGFVNKFPWTECKSGYVAHGDACYKKMKIKAWFSANCPGGGEFMVPKNEEENKFVYERFVKSSRSPFWINARTHGCRDSNFILCGKDAKKLDYNNFLGGIPPRGRGCVQMTKRNAFWTKRSNCGKQLFYICKYKSTKISKKGNDVTLDVPSLHFSVHWDGRTRIEVDINQRYEGKMCGLMGNADNNKNNDFRLPDNSPATSITEFGNSWRKNGNVVKRRSAPPDTCKDLTQLQYNEIKKKCEKMKQPPFRKCNEKIAPDIHDCEYDLCAMQQNDPSAAWCEALENYAEDCAPKGINIDWKGEAAFKECGYPCAKMPCYNGAKCENINKKKYKCFCLPGFSGRTCENVDE